MYKRASLVFLQKCKPLETIRIAALSTTIHDDLNDYALPTDYNSLIDLIPQVDRDLWDKAFRNPAGQFDIEKAVKNRTISLEGSEGTKVLRINWKERSPLVLHDMDSVTANGTWSAVATASGVVADTIIKRKGSGSIRFDVAATSDGVDNDDMTTVDMTDEDEIADVLFELYIKNSTDLANFNSITAIWGNNLTTTFWTGVAQTAQADGSAFRVGWNTIKVPWSTATETGTVAPATIDSFRITVDIDAAINDLRIDNVRFSIGRNFDIKYYSKYLFKNTGGTYISVPTDDADVAQVDDDSLPIFLFELLTAAAQQLEGVDSTFDLAFAENQLKTLYPIFRSEYPDQRVKQASRYGSRPRFQR